VIGLSVAFSKNMKPQKELATALKFWRNYLWQHRWMYVIGIFTVFVTNAGQVLLARIIGYILDFFTGNNIPQLFVKETRLETFWYIFWVYFFVRVILTLGRFGWRITLARQTHHSAGILKAYIWEHASFFPKRLFYRDYSKGPMINLSNSDIGQARFLFGFILVGTFDFVFLSITSVIALYQIKPQLTFMTLGILVILPFVIRKLSELEINFYEESQEALTELDDHSAQCVSSIRLQRQTQTGAFWTARLMNYADRYRLKRLRQIKLSLSFIPISGGMGIITQILTFAGGTHYVFNNAMTVGEFLSFQALVILLQDPLTELGFIISDWRKSLESLRRIAVIETVSKDKNLLKEMTPALLDFKAPVLEINNLNLTYQNSRAILKDFNMTLRSGERLGIKGPIGSGKSSLLNILMRNLDEYESLSGAIKLWGKDIDDFSQTELTKLVAMVPQRPFLFADTLRNNLTLDLKIEDEKVWRILELVELKEDVAQFPQGINTQLGEWGINLSGGQKQRLSLARAVARDPKLLLLDDCLSAVDTKTEEKILQNLNHYFKETALVWVAHRDSTLKYCGQRLEFTV
jgi:ATP-binding cassette subfamily B protein